MRERQRETNKGTLKALCLSVCEQVARSPQKTIYSAFFTCLGSNNGNWQELVLETVQMMQTLTSCSLSHSNSSI
jgi:hypothetical protein